MFALRLLWLLSMSYISISSHNASPTYGCDVILICVYYVILICVCDVILICVCVWCDSDLCVCDVVLTCLCDVIDKILEFCRDISHLPSLIVQNQATIIHIQFFKQANICIFKILNITLSQKLNCKFLIYYSVY